MSITVIGAGIAGLTTALTLHNAGYDVHLYADQVSPHTVSDVAAAVWKPYSTEETPRAGRWAKEALDVLREQALDPATGVVERWVNQIGQSTLPWWSEYVPTDITQIQITNAIIDGQLMPNCHYQSAVADMSIYMPWLMQQCKNAGIEFTIRSVPNLQELVAKHDAVVVCTGASRILCPDDQLLKPLTGVVLVYPKRVTDECWSMYNADDPSAPTYVNPRINTTIVGGTAITPEELAAGNLKDIAHPIHRRAIRLVPALEGCGDYKIIAGHRPYRKPEVRLEQTIVDGKPVIYNYGHGGAGVTLSWGCAMEVSIMLGANLDLTASRKPDVALIATAAPNTMPLRRWSLRARATLGWQAVVSSPAHLFAAYRQTRWKHTQPPGPPPPGSS